MVLQEEANVSIWQWGETRKGEKGTVEEGGGWGDLYVDEEETAQEDSKVGVRSKKSMFILLFHINCSIKLPVTTRIGVGVGGYRGACKSLAGLFRFHHGRRRWKSTNQVGARATTQPQLLSLRGCACGVRQVREIINSRRDPAVV